jgi:hypothetical protein
MTVDSQPKEHVTIRDVYDLVGDLRIEMGKRIDATDTAVDGVRSRLDRMEGAIGTIKWLGPSGVALLIVGVLKASGIF